MRPCEAGAPTYPEAVHRLANAILRFGIRSLTSLNSFSGKVERRGGPAKVAARREAVRQPCQCVNAPMRGGRCVVAPTSPKPAAGKYSRASQGIFQVSVQPTKGLKTFVGCTAEWFKWYAGQRTALSSNGRQPGPAASLCTSGMLLTDEPDKTRMP